MRNENIGKARSVTANIREKCDCRHEKAEVSFPQSGTPSATILKPAAADEPAALSNSSVTSVFP